MCEQPRWAFSLTVENSAEHLTLFACLAYPAAQLRRWYLLTGALPLFAQSTYRPLGLISIICKNLWKDIEKRLSPFLVNLGQFPLISMVSYPVGPVSPIRWSSRKRRRAWRTRVTQLILPTFILQRPLSPSITVSGTIIPVSTLVKDQGVPTEN